MLDYGLALRFSDATLWAIPAATLAGIALVDIRQEILRVSIAASVRVFLSNG